MAGRIFLANVGANASHRFSSPLFPDGTFEFIPIPEDTELSGPSVVRYRDLRSHYEAGRDLTDHIPSRLWDRAAHSDPEFETFTYGDNCERSARAASLKQLERGDLLFFIVRTLRAADRQHGFCLVGYLEIDEVLSEVRRRPSKDVLRRFGANAHIRRGLSDSALWDGFWVFRGTERSRRFQKAIPVTRELATRVFTAADGSPWRWDGGRTDLQVIGSYTRSCRCVIDPDLPGHRERAAILWKWVARAQGETLESIPAAPDDD